MLSNSNNYSTLNSEHNWEDLCIHLRNQQTHTSNNIPKSGEIQFSNQFLQMFHHRFANVAWVLSCKSNEQKLENIKNDPNNNSHTLDPLQSLRDEDTTKAPAIVYSASSEYVWQISLDVQLQIQSVTWHFH